MLTRHGKSHGFVVVASLLGLAGVVGASPCDPATFSFPSSILGAEHVRTTAAVVRNYTGLGRFRPDPTVVIPPEGVNPFCNVTVSYTHPGHDDTVNVHVWLPLDKGEWNERFMGTGGGGFAAGDVDGDYPSKAVQAGYVAAATDAGHLVTEGVDSWSLKAPGNVNWPLLFNFAYRSLHELAVVGKHVTREYYGQEAKFSYWRGCSTGGRQGLAVAQRYPGDFDGVLSMCPAVDLPALSAVLYYPQMVMNEAKWWPEKCELEAVVEAAVEACDGTDGRKDGIIGRLSKCEFEVEKVLGRKFKCEGRESRVHEKTVEVVKKVMRGLEDEEGKVMFPGYVPGAPFTGMFALMNSVCEGEDRGKCKGIPFNVGEAWIRLFVFKDPTFDPTSVTLQQFRDAFRLGVEQYDSILASSHDLRGFKNRGGKLLMWHGVADQVVTVLAGRNFYERAKKLDRERGVVTKDYWRYFEVPGVNHCSSMTGAPFPWDAMDNLRKWVEEGVAPEVLHARKVEDKDGKKTLGEESRTICLWPEEGVWDGKGWKCVPPGDKVAVETGHGEL
ncbi:tannase and feruloyl esterase [Colletotrichum truncatum]|uniref:Tannase and feruloyl esterase n=1 Tax=Colletotrichum truncatum TaxID=5467 RepID=A0ACC3Z701_COLTU|nr:tannase and feruloyl esterase [Colletotrichum truncatum]KAF6785249.1 tannase and feruloyl esterase [Colletotrichum truncatum]